MGGGNIGKVTAPVLLHRRSGTWQSKRDVKTPTSHRGACCERAEEGVRGGGCVGMTLTAEGVPTKRSRWQAATVRGVVQRRDWYRDVLGVSQG